MKTKEELSLIKKEFEELSSRLFELTEEDLKEVTGGSNGNAMTEGPAGAYGGSGDPGRTTTATGEIVDDSSMGVAIPMSWPDYHSYLGKTILINYCGMTVVARINDVGVLAGRTLDLQPGVFRSFGVNSAVEWGIRSVSYMVL